MTAEQRIQYAEHLRQDVQLVRSRMLESLSDNEISQHVLSNLEPWLFGPKCILPALIKVLDKGEISEQDVMNFSYVAQHSPGLQVMAVTTGRKDPTMKEIFSKEVKLWLRLRRKRA